MSRPDEISVAPGAVIPEVLPHGSGCFVGPHAFVGDGCEFESDVHVGARATITASSADPEGPPNRLLIRTGARIESGAVISGAAVIERGAIIRPGSVVTTDVPPYAIVAGNPGQVVGYSSPSSAQSGPEKAQEVRLPDVPGTVELIGGAQVIRFPEVVDLRGTLTHAEVGGLLPFQVNRFFCVYGVPSRSIRGEHAHRTLHELLIAASGSVRVSLTDGYERCEVVLDSPSVGLYLPPMVWSTQYGYEQTTSLMVLASDEYDATSYIRDFDEFMSLLE